MLFNSWTFLPFIVVVLGLYYVLPFRWQNRLLLAASYFFYGWWNWRFLALLIGSTTLDYFVARAMQASSTQRSRKFWLILTICSNLGILGIFKYFHFFLDNAVSLLQGLGLPVQPIVLEIVLPVGLSFYTFQTLAYMIGVYRRQIVAVRSWPDFALYLAFFPQLVAGPIERPTRPIPQIVNPRTISAAQVRQGLWLILMGLFKKMVIADNLSAAVNGVFGASDPSGAQCLLAVYGFAIQIYCDFSGYTDIARGLAKLMGVELVLNFDRPYLAQNPAEFWRRWHISLSSWLRDYLYIPLGGSRGGKWQTYRNLMLTMLLGGLWHGAAWTFVLWGYYHGALLVIHRILTGGKEGPPRTGISAAVARIGMFHLTCLGWLFFRARSMEQIGQFLRAIGTSLALDPRVSELLVMLLALGGVLMLLGAWLRNTDDPWTRPLWRWGLGPLTASLMLAALLFVASPAGQQFIYFQF